MANLLSTAVRHAAGMATAVLFSLPAAAQDDVIVESNLGEMVGRPIPRIAAPGSSPDGAGSRPGATAAAAPIPLVLRGTWYDVTIVGALASVTLEQEFVNDSPHSLEAAYTFPLPPGAAVHSLRMEVGDRVLEGVVREKEEARREMQHARQTGRRASLLEQQRPNVFRSRVTNVQPGDAVLVRVGFGFEVPFAAGRYRLRLPLVVAQRFVPAPTPGEPQLDEELSQPPRASRAALRGRALEVDVRVAAGLPLSELHSPSHALSIETVDSETLVRLDHDDETADRDYVLHYALGAKTAVGQAAYVSPEASDWREVMLLLTPPAQVESQWTRPKEVLFIIDSSGSMGNGSLEAAQSALASCLRRLDPADRFNVTDYDSRHRLYESAPVDAHAPAVDDAVLWVERLRASGGTNLLPALVATLQQPEAPGHHRIVILLTDGQVGNEAQVDAALAAHLGSARLFVLGIGTAPNQHLVNEMARTGRGTASFISPGISVEEEVDALFASVAAPLEWDLSLATRDGELTDVYPARLPDLYAGRPVTVFGRVRDRGRPFTLEVTSETMAGVRMRQVEVDLSSAPEHAVVGKLWARARIAELERGLRRAAADRTRTPDQRLQAKEDVRDELVEVALEHGLVSSATSFVVVERHPIASGGPDRLHEVPAATQAAWPRTATRRPRVLALGLAFLATGFGLLLASRRLAALELVR
jgi:Ca-activated chloride channel family protein